MSNWQLDTSRTKVEFSARHLGVVTVRGHFAEVSTAAVIDPAYPERSSIQVTIQAASIRTHNAARDQDICSSRFLEVDKFPVLTFTSTNIEPSGEDGYTLTGDLTVKGNTHPVSLQVVKQKESSSSMERHRIYYRGQAQINRKNFGLSFNLILDGKFVVSDEIQIMIEGELVDQQEEAKTIAGQQS